ncbi:probable SOD2 - superoxide dismutase (Mn) precursor, mitochondrial [Melanopsichium pennsylvanicum]|uniref:Superoxide dismutase n=2 Tax=Melanopsichium pennsylvanicum TaxID=63383 RepID=A0AAJ4XHA0_9BASI|nr:probable SOD2-superoxide dismutase (Mn) precursor, mitochondrial [Melanopsichium pennsylvanicum 4]SNX82128.1 probable SOD2 - superoxide dismutase (Mn) precursor, mitochondrial [Melanopsichium pennsylvanicum]
MLRIALTRSTLGSAVRSAPNRAFAASTIRAKHTLPDLPYDYSALEPAISAQIMELHHTKHHQTYVNGLNTAEEQLSEALHKKDTKSAIALQKAINFNGGGHINHTLFWENLAPPKQGGGELSNGVLKDAIERDFGGLDALKTKFNAQIAAIQGSGWGWIGYNPTSNKLDIVTTANQDPLLSHVPLIGVDAWEHAFYLQYQNVKADYFKAIWNVINFKAAEERLKKAQ